MCKHLEKTTTSNGVLAHQEERLWNNLPLPCTVSITITSCVFLGMALHLLYCAQITMELVEIKTDVFLSKDFLHQNLV